MVKMFNTKSTWFKLFQQVKNIYKHRCCSSAAAVQVTPNSGHIPVMKDEVMHFLSLNDGDTVLDMTFGAGGHTRYLLDRYPNLKVLALDRDPLAYQYAKKLQQELPNQVTPLLGRFSELNKLAIENNIPLQSVDGVIFDLGASSMQMDSSERGFGVSHCGPLDMRMDSNRYSDSITAADVVNHASEDELYRIFKMYGEEKQSRVIARSIVQARITYQQFNTTSDIADLVDLVCSKPRQDKLQRRAHSATKVFQGLRIFVNNELNELNLGLVIANFILKMGGRIVVLSFHSLEDTIAKRHFQGHIFDNSAAPIDQLLKSSLDMSKELQQHRKNAWNVINKKVVVPTKEEVNLNPRSRSAKLRAAIKTDCIRLKSCY